MGAKHWDIGKPQSIRIEKRLLILSIPYEIIPYQNTKFKIFVNKSPIFRG